ncbi:hypothetical protein [Nitrosomonas sp. ANs5]|uniref:hypothetical protein n=1 Tax=Nitrosomonas sp. ANs5 TaxID=3423941 RepID=UPI003D33A031
MPRKAHGMHHTETENGPEAYKITQTSRREAAVSLLKRSSILIDLFRFKSSWFVRRARKPY